MRLIPPTKKLFFLITALSLIMLLAQSGLAQADILHPPNPVSGSVGLEGTVQGAPPTQAPTITTPSNGQSFSSQPITVTGLCKTGLLVKVFDNNVFVGSVECTNGSFTIKVSLFNGSNTLVTQLYDALDQAGPASGSVTVSFSSGQFAGLGPLLSLTSTYAKRGTNPGQTLTWPIIINGGTGPYAMSVDWGDGSNPQLISEPFSGPVNISHVYNTAGTYEITIEITDRNGEAAFLQLVGLANGPATQSSANTNKTPTKTITTFAWWPVAAMLPLILIAFWLGRRHEVTTLRKQLEHIDRQ